MIQLQHENQLTKKPENNASLPGGFGRPSFILPHDPDHLRDIQQVVQGIGSVPELMLLPVAGGHRQEEELVNIRAFDRLISQTIHRPSSATGGGFESPPPKKTSSVHTASSIVSFRQTAVSCSSSG